MTTEQLKAKLVNGLTTYDRRQSKKRGYNHHALAIYLQRVDEIVADVERGAPVNKALQRGFCGAVLKAACQAVGIVAPDNNDRMIYEPITKE